LVDSTGWNPEDLRVFLAILIALNFVVGLILLREPQEKLKGSSPIVEEGARQNIFLLALSIYLLLNAFDILINIFYDNGLLSTPDWLRNAAWTLLGIISLLAGLSFLWAKNTPRNFGFGALVAALLLNGITVEALAINPESSLFPFIIIGTISLISAAFFISQPEVWRNIGFLTLCGFLLSSGVAGIAFDTPFLNTAFLGISSLFAIPAAIFFLRR